MFKRLFVVLLLVQVVALGFAQTEDPQTLMEIVLFTVKAIVSTGVIRIVLGFIVRKLPPGIGTLVMPFVGFISKKIEESIANKDRVEQQAATLELARKTQAAENAVAAVDQLHKTGKVPKEARLKTANKLLHETIGSDKTLSSIVSAEEARTLLEAAVARKQKLDEEYLAKLKQDAEREFAAIAAKNASVLNISSEPVAHHEA